MRIDASVALEENRIRVRVDEEDKAGGKRKLKGLLYVTEQGLTWRSAYSTNNEVDWDEFIDWMRS